MKNIICTAAIFFCSIVPLLLTAQNTEAVIRNIDKELKSGRTTVSDVLSSETWMYLHSLTPFREMIKANAKTGKITIATNNEPGKHIMVKGLVVNKQGVPQKDLIVYAYHTSDKGWYSDTAAHILINSGDMNHARLFGYFKTDDQGGFEINTIQARGYPNSDLPAHIHIHFWSATRSFINGPGELLFDDDPRLTPERRKQALANGFIIEKNSGTSQRPVYEYRIVVD